MPVPFSDWLIPRQGFEYIPWCIAPFLSFLLLLQMASIQNMEGARITVWQNGGGEGRHATANFVSGGYKAVPPLKDMFNRAGMGLPEYLGTTAKEVKGEEGEKEKGLELLG